MPFAATRTDLEMVSPSEVGQTEKGKYYRRSLTCGIENDTKENDTKELTKQNQTLKMLKQNLLLPKGKRGGGKN